jgi:anti-anti-sigma factor
MLYLARINYNDSTGIGELEGFQGRVQEVKRKLILVEPSEPIKKLLKVAHLDQLFPIYGSLPDAIAGESETRVSH